MSDLPALALLSVRLSPWAPSQPAALASLASLELPLDRFQLALSAYLDADGLARLGRTSVRLVLLDLRAAPPPRGTMILPVRRAAPGARLVVIGPEHDPALAECAVRLGASGYLSTDLSANTLRQALSDASQGDVSYSGTGKRAVQALLRGKLLPALAM